LDGTSFGAKRLNGKPRRETPLPLEEIVAALGWALRGKGTKVTTAAVSNTPAPTERMPAVSMSPEYNRSTLTIGVSVGELSKNKKPGEDRRLEVPPHPARRET